MIVSRYSVRAAMVDAVEGAWKPRAPVRRVKPEGIGYGWQALLVVLSGLVVTGDQIFDSPLAAGDLPEGFAGQAPVIIPVLTFLLLIAFLLVFWLLLLPGVRLCVRGLGWCQVGSALALGLWTAILPSAALAVSGLVFTAARETLAAVSAFLGLAYAIITLAAFGEIGLWRSAVALLVGTLLPIAVAGALVLGVAFIFKIQGFGL